MKKGRTQKSMIFQIPHCPSVLGIWNLELGTRNLELGTRNLKGLFPSDGAPLPRCFRYAVWGPPCADHRARTGRTDGPVEMT